jgi:pyruvate dehydrogenase E2 component (dihydrolipoyllysine-residue acetyltransferase)
MSVDVVMPKLSDTMEEGKILRWLKKPGDRVAKGEALAEVETDKADMELESESAGVLGEILVDEGGSAAVGQKIATLADGGANGGAAPGNGSAAAGEEAAEERSAAPLVERPAKPPVAARTEDRPARRTVPPPTTPRATGPRPMPKPAAAVEPPAQTSSPADASATPAKTPAAGAREELSRIRRTVARRMAESKRDVPHFYMTVEIEMAECAKLKTSLGTARPDAGVSYTHLLLRAVALALAEHPRINAHYVPEDVVEFPDGIHLGIAVALDEGLIVPVLHDCESKDVFEIAASARALVERVRAGKAEGGDLSGGTFTVSNLGMYPIDEFAAVINPPQAAVLAVGALAERPVVRDEKVVASTTMRVTLSSDHRVIDGAEAARFLATLKSFLESPLRLVL